MPIVASPVHALLVLNGTVIVMKELSELYRTFRRQQIVSAFLLAMLFSFLAFSPVLSPFVYPLF